MSTYNIYIEGNIACGKSTLIEHLKSKLGEEIEFFQEPLEKWKDCNGSNLLQLMYEHPKKFSFHLQSFIQCTMFEIQVSKSKFPIKVTERSLLSERFVFIQYLNDHKLISELEFNILTKWFELLNKLTPKVDEIIYLRTQPEEVYDHLKLRARVEEKTVGLDYLIKLHELHENWLVDKTFGFVNDSPVTIIEQNFDQYNTTIIYDKLVDRLKAKLENVRQN